MLFDDFIEEFDVLWTDQAGSQLALRVLGSAALFMQTPYLRGTKDSDIDLERRHGPPDPEAHRAMFEDIITINIDDGVIFDRVLAKVAWSGWFLHWC